MPYTPPYPSGWEDSPNTSTPITAAALDTIDTGITDVTDEVDDLLTPSEQMVIAYRVFT